MDNPENNDIVSEPIAVYRNYRVRTGEDARVIGREYLENVDLKNVIEFGLPEIDDRYNFWRLPLKATNGERIGEIVIDAKTTFIDRSRTTGKEILENRLLGRNDKPKRQKRNSAAVKLSTLRNTIGIGDSEKLLKEIPNESIDLVFTSPPYFNARPEYSEYLSYSEYLLKMRRIIHECGRVLNEGRFFVLNVSPVLLRRASRNEASHRLAVPFDFHALFIEEGFEFMDDIIWVKPEGAGWATGRGRRFAADRNPCQYKPVPVTEYVLVYRKKSEQLIDWLIRKHPDQKLVEESKIQDGYEVTNIWKIHPAHSREHPAVFPEELASKVISYYSFKNDVVLDPFAGTGTTAVAAIKADRRFAAFEMDKKYVSVITRNIDEAKGLKPLEINWIKEPQDD